MKSLIYIELTESVPTAYEKELISWAKNQFPGISTFDLDNHSEVLMFSYAETLAEQADRLVVYVKTREVPAGKFIRLAEKLIARKFPILVIMQGENALLSRMFSVLKDSFYKGLSEEEGKKMTEEFLGQ